MAYIFKKITGGGGGLIDVTELPSENIQKDAIYRLTNTIQRESSADVWMIIHDNGIIKDTVNNMAEQQGFTIETYLVDTLPDSLEQSSEKEMYFYVLDSTGVVYVDMGSGAVSYGSMLGDTSFDKGWTDNIEAETDMGIYSVRIEGATSTYYTYYTYEDNEWVEISGGDVVDLINVEELPTTDINKNAVYHLTETQVVDVYVFDGTNKATVTDYLKSSGYTSVEVNYYLVDSLPTTDIQTTVFNNSAMTALCHVYVQKEDGKTFMSVDGSTFISCAATANVGDNGWADSTDDIVNVGTYTLRKIVNEYFQYQNEEWKIAVLRNDVVYKTTIEESASAEVWLVAYNANESIKMTIVDYFLAQGTPVTVPTYVVDKLPETMETINLDTLFVPVYILKDTGIGYVSQDGTPENAVTAGTMLDGLPDKGWATDIESLTPTEENTGLYSVMGEAPTSYTFYLYEDGVLTSYGAGSGEGLIEVDALPTEDINDDVVYVFERREAKDIVFANNGSVTLFSSILNSDYSLNFIVVDELSPPFQKMEDNVNKISTFYVLASNGYLYASEDGTTAVSVADDQHGWISNTSEASANGWYTLGGNVQGYGIPNNAYTKQVWEYIEGSWVDMHAEIENRGDKITDLENENSALESQVTTLTDEKTALNTQVETLEGEVATLEEEISSQEPLMNFAQYAVLEGSDADGVVLTDMTNTDIISIVIPDTINGIGEEAFTGCSKLTSVEVGSGMNNIKAKSFYNINSLTDITISPDNPRLSNVDGFIIDSDTNTLLLTKSFKASSDDRIVIPSDLGITHIADYVGIRGDLDATIVVPNSVTTIGDNSLDYNTIILGSGIQHIGAGSCIHSKVIYAKSASAWAKMTCGDLYELTAGRGESLYFIDENENILEEITITGVSDIKGMYRFINTRGVKNIIIADDVQSIENGVFDNIIELNSVHIGSGLANLGTGNFIEGTLGNFNSLTVSKDNSVYHSTDNCMIKTADKTLVLGCAGSVIPDDGSVTKIGGNAFFGSIPTNLVIPDSINEIGYSIGGGELTHLTIGRGVTKFGSSAFYCPNLEEIYFNAVAAECDVRYDSDLAFRYAGRNKDSVKAIIGTSVSKIPKYLFKESSITDVEFEEESVCASIEDYAFKNCTRLTSITIPDSVTSIGNEVFYGCTGLTSAAIGNNVTQINSHAFYNCSNLTSLTLPNNLESIGSGAFRNCSGLTSITIPANLTTTPNSSIGAFLDCVNLKSVYITDMAKWCAIDFWFDTSNPLYYAGDLYLNGELVTDLVIPDGVTRIGYSAFDHCKSITSAIIPSSVTKIDARAFKDCLNMNNVRIGDGVRVIQSEAFENCSNLTNVILSNSLEYINISSFRACTSLKNIVIPESIIEIRGGAFSDCSSLNAIEYKGTKEQWKAIALTEGWDNGTPDYIITCTDGTIAKDGTET